MDWIYPLIAIVLVFFTPKGRYHDINIILAALLSAHYGWELYIANHFDSVYHDIYMLGIYSFATWSFYRLCGDIQAVLGAIGIGLSVIYGIGWFFVAYPHDFFYKEAMVILTVVQLLAASRGALWTLLNKAVNWVEHGNTRTNYHGSERRSMPRNPR